MRSFCPTFNTALWFGIFVVLETVTNQNLLISAPYVLFLTEGYKISQLITIYKCLNYMKVLLNILKTCLLCISLYTVLRETNYNILSLCKPATTTQGRPGGSGGGGGSGIPVYPKKIGQNTQKYPKFIQIYLKLKQVYHIPEIQRK